MPSVTIVEILKKSVHPSYYCKFLKFWQKSPILQKVQKVLKNQPKTAEPKQNFFSYSQPLGPEEHLPGWGSSDL